MTPQTLTPADWSELLRLARSRALHQHPHLSQFAMVQDDADDAMQENRQLLSQSVDTWGDYGYCLDAPERVPAGYCASAEWYCSPVRFVSRA